MSSLRLAGEGGGGRAESFYSMQLQCVIIIIIIEIIFCSKDAKVLHLPILMLLTARYLKLTARSLDGLIIVLISRCTLHEISQKSLTCKTIYECNPGVHALTAASLSLTGTEPFWLGFVSFSWLISSAVPLLPRFLLFQVQTNSTRLSCSPLQLVYNTAVYLFIYLSPH